MTKSADKSADGHQPPWATVVIVNYNAKRFLQDALDCLAEQTDQDFEVILLDNGSTDGSTDNLYTDHLPSFQLIALDENTGFARGNNIAAKAARGEWLALLNPDTQARPDWLSEFRQATESFPEDVSFAGATISMSDPDTLDGAGDCYLGLGIPWRGGYGRPVRELPDIGTCFSSCGASALYRRNVFLDVGGFDESFFCYCEDVDLGFRLNLIGIRTIFWPTSQALHYGNGSTFEQSPFSVKYGTRNRLWVFIKNTPLPAFVLLFPIHLAISVVLIARVKLAGQQSKPFVSGLWEGLLGFPRIWRVRQKIQKRRTVSSLGILQTMSWQWSLLRQKRTDIRPV